ncbi:MAG: gamma-glutamyltransferase [Deltaproteobacteria bacterium]|nr:gamma-glutamyltransferase [Deltaproteobacteria bacterium]
MRDIQFPGRSAVMSTHGMIATSQPMAVQVGLEVLKQGGNAMDAAIAASAVLCVTEPQSTGIGGDCFLLYHEAKTGTLHGLNGSGRAPALATPQAFRERGLRAVPERGALSISVPGAVAAWAEALEKFGTRSLEAALQPAIRFAEEGYAVTPVVAHFWNRNEALLQKDEDARRDLLVEGLAPRAGSRHRQPNLARSLRLIAQQGARAFYQGELAKRIAEALRAKGGLIGEDDLAAHRSEWVQPISTEYRGLRVCEIPPNGQGITALMALNILEHTPLGRLERLSVEHVHAFSEAFRLAYTERNRWVADPAAVDVPVAALLDKAFAKRQWSRIDMNRALPLPLTSALLPGGAPHRDTIYLTVVDKDRNCCSFINSLFNNFGSGVMAGQTGVLLQNRASGFVLEPDHPNQIAPGKRPMHTIIPAMVYRGAQPVLSYGVMGGQYQAMGHAYVLSNWLDFGLDVQEALDAPRFLPEPFGDALTVERGIGEALRKALSARGHRVVEAEVPLGGGQMIHLDPDSGVLSAASDPRKDGCAMGY